MKVTLVGSRYFGALVFEALRKDGVDIARVVAPAADDRLALAAKGADVPLHVLANPKQVPGEAIADGTGLIVAAHTHARVSNEALARSRLGGIGYHPSLLPRHRGIAAVEWTIMEGDPIAGGSVYHLADGWDAGAVAAQDWCFVGKGETARELWERALAPMGLALLTRVVRHAAEHDELPAFPQDPRFATKAPLVRRTVSLTDESKPEVVSLVVTAIGMDRPGIVRQLSERAQGFGANWAGSRMANIAGQFAGMVHFEVPTANAAASASSSPRLRRRLRQPGAGWSRWSSKVPTARESSAICHAVFRTAASASRSCTPRSSMPPTTVIRSGSRRCWRCRWHSPTTN
jgi:methionyl-tRNA formyltransferase